MRRAAVALRPGARDLDGHAQRQQVELKCDRIPRGYDARDIRDLRSALSVNRLELGLMQSFA